MKPKADDRQNKSWLVKSSTRILGPYAADEIGQLLLKKHISIIDEVRPPVGRWRYVREHRIFDDVVQILRSEQESSPEHTQTQTMTQTATATSTSTLPLPVLARAEIVETDEVTLTPTPAPVKTESLSPLAGVRDVAPVRETNLPTSDATFRGSSSSYAAAGDRRVEAQMSGIQKKLRWFFLGLIAVAIGVAAVMMLRQKSARNVGYEQFLQEALRDRSLGLNERALEAYKKAAQIHEPDADAQEQMAMVLISLDHQNVSGRRILEREVQEDPQNRARVTDASLGIAMSYILEGSLREAEDTLQRILVSDPSNFGARLNLGLISVRKGDWKEADRQLEDISRRYPAHPLVLLARAVTLIESGEMRDLNRVHSLILEIQSLFTHTEQLKSQLLLAMAAMLPTQDPSFAPLIASFLGQPLVDNQDFARDLRLDWRLSDWDALERTCRALADRNPGQPRVKALRAVCLAQSGQDGESRRILQEALAEAPKDPLTLYTQANLLEKAGLRNEAVAILRLPELAPLAQREALNGDICLDQGDLGCAEKSYRAVVNGGTRPLSVLAGLANVLHRQGNVKEAKNLVHEGLDREPGYLPLIELRAAMEDNR